MKELSIVGMATLDALKTLAAQVGVTVVQIYPYFVRQVWLEALMGVLFGLVSFGVLAPTGIFFGKQVDKWIQAHPNAAWSETPDWVDFWKGGRYVCIVVGGILFCLFMVVNIPDLLNPQYGATQKLMRLLVK